MPEVIGKVIHKLLAKRPEDRYQTPAELAQVLQAFLHGQPVQVDLAPSIAPSNPVPAARAANPFAGLGSDETLDQAMPETVSPVPQQKPAQKFWLAAIAAACVIGLLLIVVLRKSGPEPGSPPPGKVKAVVEATSRWQDTLIDLEADTTVTVTVQGKLKKKDWPECSAAGLDGQPRDRTLLLEFPPLCLLGRIGEQEPFPLGNVKSIRPREGGRLFVQVNDLDVREVSGRLTLEVNPARQSSILVKRPGPLRIQAAEAALEALAANLARSQGNLVELARHVQDFREKHEGKPATARASMLWHSHLVRLPSPLDRLDAAALSADSRELWRNLDQPKELVAVLGEPGARPVTSLAFSQDDRFLLYAVAEKASFFDFLFKKEMKTFDADKKILALALSPKMDLAVAATGANALPLWNPQTGKEVGKLIGHKAPANSVIFSFNGGQAVSGGQDGTVRLWDVAGSKEVRRWGGFTGSVLRAALSADGRTLAAAGQDLTMRFWNFALADDKGVVVKGYSDPVSAMAFAPDGWTLATAHNNGQIKFWDLAQKEPKERAAGLAIPGAMPALAYSPDGRWLLAGSQTGDLILWEAASEKKLWEWKLPAPVASLAFAADSRHVALGLGNGTVVIFRDPDLAEKGFQKLLARAADPGVDHEKLLRDVAHFRGRFAGLPQARTVAEIFWKLPSPLDRLDPANIPDIERLDWQPKELVAILGSHRLRHQAGVVRVALSPDGKTLATATVTGDIVLFDAATGKELKRLGNHGGDVLSLAFDEDGQLLASAGLDGTAKMWNLRSGKTVHSLNGMGPVAAAFSPDGKLLATVHGTEVEIRDVKGPKEQILSLAFSAHGEMLATGSQAGDIRLWDVNSAKSLDVLAQKEGPVAALAFHPDKKLLASAANTVKLWDVTAGAALKTWPGGNSLAFDKTGNLLAFASFLSVKIWDAAEDKLTELKGHIGAVRSVSFAAGSKILATGSDDETARLWDVPSGKEMIPLDGYNGFPLAFSPDGRSLVCCGQNFHGPQLWNLETLKPRTFIPQAYPAHGLAFSPDGLTLASCNYAGDTRLLLWDVARPGQYLLALGHTGGISQTAFSPDGRKAASCSSDNTVHFWDPFTGKALGTPLVAHPLGVNCLAFSPDGRWLATGGNDNSARLWDLRSCLLVHSFAEHGQAVRSVVFSRDGALLAPLCLDGQVRVWELAKRKLRTSLDAPPGTMLWVLAISPDDKMLATSSDKGGIFLWELASGKKLKEWRLPFRVLQVAFAPDARHLAVANGNGTISILRLGKGPAP